MKVTIGYGRVSVIGEAPRGFLPHDDVARFHTEGGRGKKRHAEGIIKSVITQP